MRDKKEKLIKAPLDEKVCIMGNQKPIAVQLFHLRNINFKYHI